MIDDPPLLTIRRRIKRPERSLREHFERYMTVRLDNFAIADGEIEDGGQGRLVKYGASA